MAAGAAVGVAGLDVDAHSTAGRESDAAARSGAALTAGADVPPAGMAAGAAVRRIVSQIHAGAIAIRQRRLAGESARSRRADLVHRARVAAGAAVGAIAGEDNARARALRGAGRAGRDALARDARLGAGATVPAAATVGLVGADNANAGAGAYAGAYAGHQPAAADRAARPPLLRRPRRRLLPGIAGRTPRP